jgi:hypothetical protein
MQFSFVTIVLKYLNLVTFSKALNLHYTFFLQYNSTYSVEFKPNCSLLDLEFKGPGTEDYASTVTFSNYLKKCFSLLPMFICFS